MQINWCGQSCFNIELKQGKNKKVKLVIDPFKEGIGLKVSKLKADILLISHDHDDHNNITSVSTASEERKEILLINSPGEYEAEGVFIQGIPAFHDNEKGKEKGKITIFIIKAEEMKICYLSDLGQEELTEDQLSQIGEVDILMIPVGGKYTISGSNAAKIMAQIEPKITIPMHYKMPGLKIELDSVDVFLKEIGIKEIEPVEKIKIQKSDLSADEAKVIVLKV